MPNERNLALSFFDRFLDERNIQWILAIGMLIVLASSLLLVGWNWHEAGFTPWWKYLTLVAYWGLVNGAGEWGYYRLGLRKTGTVLMALAVLLVPISFLALRWLETTSLGAPWGAALLVLNFAASAAVVVRVFGHFLRGPQPAFMASYLLLSLGWAVVPGVDWSVSPIVTLLAGLGLWLAFALGVMRVNDHVFWLVERHQTPRVFGFLPILLLGAEFLGLFGFYLAPQVSLSWWGLACVLTAVPVLHATDRIACIHNVRREGAVRPLPWSIVMPLGIGLLLCAAGVVLACVELRPPHVIPPALVPTAALASAMMGLLARRTQRQAFVWMMLILASLAYNFSYVVCKDAVRALLAEAASAISESRLPIAYYGLTYLPFIAVLIAGTVRCRLRGNLLFAVPMQTFAMLLAGLLLLVSGTHPKALFPVGCALTGVFACQAWFFRERGLLLGAGVAWLAACGGFAPFAAGVAEWDLGPHGSLNGLVLGAGVLASLGRSIDCRASTLPIHAELPAKLDSCQGLSLAASHALAFVWWFMEGQGGALAPTAWPAAVGIAVLLVTHALRLQGAPLSVPAYAFAASTSLLALSRLSLSEPQWFTLVLCIFLVQWTGARALSWAAGNSRLWGRIEKTFQRVLEITSCVTLSVLVTAFFLPIAWINPGELLFLAGWPIYLLACGWAMHAAYHLRLWGYAVLGGLAFYSLVAALQMLAVGHTAWVPATIAAFAISGLQLVARIERTSRPNGDRSEAHTLGLQAITTPLDYLLSLTLLYIGATSCPCLDTNLPGQLAEGIAALGLLGVACSHPSLAMRRTAWAVLNLQAISLAMRWGDLTPPAFSLLTAASLLVWQRFEADGSVANCIARIFRGLLRTLTTLGILLVWADIWRPFHAEVLVGGLTFLLVSLSEAMIACRRQSIGRAWIALAVLLGGFAYFIEFGVIPVDACMFLCVGLAGAFNLLAHLARRGNRTPVLAGPLDQLGQVLPLATVGLALVRHLSFAFPHWLGMNSLAVLLAAGFYFWRAIEQQDRRYWLLPAAILNVAIALLWRELDYSDPQFFMIPIGISVLALVEWLRGEIPAHLHDPLRYLGALLILVSPTFHIVEGSWLHMATLMLASVAVVLVSIGIQVRASMYLGTAFLLADLVSMLVRGSIDHPNLLWITGLALGAAIVALAAVCENHRERVLQRIRLLSAALERWH